MREIYRISSRRFFLTTHNLLQRGAALALGEHGPTGDRQSARNFVIAWESGARDEAAALALPVADGTTVAFNFGAAAAAGKARRPGLCMRSPSSNRRDGTSQSSMRWSECQGGRC